MRDKREKNVWEGGKKKKKSRGIREVEPAKGGGGDRQCWLCLGGLRARRPTQRGFVAALSEPFCGTPLSWPRICAAFEAAFCFLYFFLFLCGSSYALCLWDPPGPFFPCDSSPPSPHRLVVYSLFSYLWDTARFLFCPDSLSFLSSRRHSGAGALSALPECTFVSFLRSHSCVHSKGCRSVSLHEQPRCAPPDAKGTTNVFFLPLHPLARSCSFQTTSLGPDKMILKAQRNTWRGVFLVKDSGIQPKAHCCRTGVAVFSFGFRAAVERSENIFSLVPRSVPGVSQNMSYHVTFSVSAIPRCNLER